ncbi:MAG: 4-hydroxythreonine-4-phosphate dehydrogenase PdxA [Fuerstia sp.]|nr:4-hydroxythreonine-4-phosphate dehydrogenase PdxA [Fuerstiella sp.]
MKRVIAITAGDIAGIGPEVILRAIAQPAASSVCCPVLVGHPEIFRRAAEVCGISVSLQELNPTVSHPSRVREDIISAARQRRIPCVNPFTDAVLAAPHARVSREAGDAAFHYLDAAITLAKQSAVDAIVTAPLNKEALHLAGHNFPGHTEILAERCGVAEFAMMLHLPESALTAWRQLIRPHASSNTAAANEAALSGLSIAHVTLHTSIASVPQLLTQDSIVEKIRLMDSFLQRIHCQRRAIAVCALNPHGGENGLFGDEESRLIRPAVDACAAFVQSVTGPLPVDTLIRRAVSGEFDGVVAMYHDQGHIPVKLIGFDAAVNITLGLPIVRTSPTHGTAFDRAWNPQTPADASGMTEAIRMAAALAKR